MTMLLASSSEFKFSASYHVCSSWLNEEVLILIFGFANRGCLRSRFDLQGIKIEKKLLFLDKQKLYFLKIFKLSVIFLQNYFCWKMFGAL